MKNRITGMLVLIFAAAFLSVSDGWARSLTIIANPGPFPNIGKAAFSEQDVDFWDSDKTDDTACSECFAAVELRSFIAKVTEYDEQSIHLSSATELPAAGDVIILGTEDSNPLLRKTAPASDNEKLLSPDSFRMKAFSDNGRTVCVIEGKTGIGTLYGAYEYIERLGVHFIGIGEQGTVYPEHPVDLVRNIDIVENPKFLTRGYCTRHRGTDVENFFLWMVRNRLNLWSADAPKEVVHLLKKYGMKLSGGFHDIQKDFLGADSEYPYPVSAECGDDVNKDGKLSYFEAHPEWFGLIDGKRSGAQGIRGANFCTSNKDAVSEISKNFVQSLIDGKWRYADVIYFWMLDLGKWCECENCQQLGSCTDRLFKYLYEVNLELQKAQKKGLLNREIHLSTLAYRETVPPPERPLPDDFDYENCSVTFFPDARCYAHVLADPECTEINQYYKDNYLKWAESPNYRGSMFVGEYYNKSGHKSLPSVWTHIMAADIPWYYKHGARHFHYMHTLTSLRGTWTWNEYLMARLLWNPDINVDDLFEKYLTLYYPTTGAQMRGVYENLEKAFANIQCWKHAARGPGGKIYELSSRFSHPKWTLFSLDHLQYNSRTGTLNNAVSIEGMTDYIQQAEKHLDQALFDCSNDVEKLRLLEDVRRVDYGEAMIFFYYHLVRTVIFDRRGDEQLARYEFQRTKPWADRLMSIVDMVQVSAKDADSENGFIATGVSDFYRDLEKKYMEGK